MLLLATALQAPGMNFAALISAAQAGRHVEGVQFHPENVERALKITDELIKMEPLRGIPWNLRAQAFFALGRFSEALAACERSIDIDPSDPAKWITKGRILRVMGQTADADAAEQKSQELRS